MNGVPSSDEGASEPTRAPAEVVVWIVNYSSASLTRRCVGSISSPLVRRIVILDNASPDGREAEELRDLAAGDPRVRVIASPRNLGFGGGHNAIARATEMSPAEFVWLLNPDTVVNEGVIEVLAETIASDQADIVSPTILSGEETLRVWHCGGTLDRRTGRVHDTLVGRDPRALVSSPSLLYSSFLSGAAPMMRRETWDSIGGFDEALFLYWEDADLCIRAQERGHRLAARTDATIWHAEGGSSKGDRRGRAFVFYLISRNRILVCRESVRHGWSLLVGPGTSAFLRLFAYAGLRGGRGGLSRSIAVLRGGFVGAFRRM